MKNKIVPAIEKPIDPSNSLHDPVYFRSMVIYYTCFMRALEIGQSFVFSFNKKHHLSCVLLTRSAQELFAWIYVVKNCITVSLEKNDLKTINKVFDKFLGGSKIFTVIHPNGSQKRIQPFGSGEVVSEMKEIIPEWGKDYDFLNEIIHFNHGGQEYYREIVLDRNVSFFIPTSYPNGMADLMLISINLMLEFVLHCEKDFQLFKYPDRLMSSR